MTSETDQGSVDLVEMAQDDLLGDTVELSAVEIDRLLDEEDEEAQPETVNGDVEKNNTEQLEKNDETEDKEKRSRDIQGSRPHKGNRIFRGGGPRFFYPVGMHRGMVPPPFALFGQGRPPFGPMRRLGPIPPPHVMRMAMMRAAPFGPKGMRPRMARDEKPEVSKSKPEAPKPLMSIEIHDPGDLLRFRASRAPLGMGLGSHFQPRAARSNVDSLPYSRPIQRDLNRPMKRPGSSFQDEPRTKVFNTGRIFQQVPRYGDQSELSGGSLQNRIQRQSCVVAHKPAPNLTLIQLTPAATTTSHSCDRSGTKVRLSNLPRTANFSEITALTTSCGAVRNLNVSRETNSAVIEFESPQSVDTFVATYNNTILGNHLLSATRIG